MKARVIRTISGLALLCLTVIGVHGAELEGRIELVGDNGKPLPSREARNGVVYFQPASPVRGSTKPGTFVVETRGKQFVPRVLPITLGSRVRFPNADPILHNVFSVSPGNRFDLGLYGEGEGVEHLFESPGLVRVFCNVHHSMVAYILVLDTPHFTRPEDDGRFRLDGLPASGKLTVWHDGGEPWTRELKLPLAEPLTVEYEVTQRRVPPHLDKLGEPYRREDRGRYR